MNIQEVPFCTADWDKIAPTEHPGATGKTFWRTFEMGNIRVRIVDQFQFFIINIIGGLTLWMMN